MLYNYLFHRVHPAADPLWDPMRPALFEHCVRHIIRKHTVVCLEDFLQDPLLPGEGKTFATISFDDGYKDNLQYAAPILEKYNCKASFYVVTDCIDQQKLTWTHQLEHAFQHTAKVQLAMDFPFLPEGLRVSQLDTLSQRLGYINRLKPWLRVAPHSQRSKVLARVLEAYDDVEFPQLMMNWDEVRQLQSAGHYIGSHSRSHGVLNTVEDEWLLEDELLMSGQKIGKELGRFPLSIAYPLGKYDNRVVESAQKAGYKFGLAVGQKVYIPGQHHSFAIPRIELYNEPWWKTRMRMNGSLELIKSSYFYKFFLKNQRKELV